jgi:hypothetical protein
MSLNIGISNASVHGVDILGRPLTDEVLAYVVRHPYAQDTVEGIVEWWLLEQHIYHAVSDVEAALRQLVENEFLVARRASGRTYYGLNRAKECDIRRHLKNAQMAHETRPQDIEPQD